MKYFDEGDGLIKLVISSRNAENDVNYTFINLRLRRNSIYDYFRLSEHTYTYTFVILEHYNSA